MTAKLLFKGIDEPDLATLGVYEQRGGYQSLRKALQMPAEAVLNELLASGLRGRGGAGFAMGKKASFLPKGTMDKYLVCNADESEPGTFKDRELIQKNPHLLIEGIVIAAHAAGINRAFIYIRGEYEQQAEILDRALVEAAAAGYIGDRILGSELSLSLVLHRGAGAYICGEETGLLDSLEGKRGNPRLKPPFPANQGLYQGPTLINNVETLATVPHIIRMGGDEYAKLGTETSTGTKLVSVSGHVQRPGNYEVELGTPSREIIYDMAGGPPARPGGEAVVPGRVELARADGRGSRPALRLQHSGQGRVDARVGGDHRRRRLDPGARRRAEAGQVLPSRVVRQVHAVPGGDQLDGADARADRPGRGDADGSRHHGERPGAHHRQLPVRARRRHGDADRVDDQEVPQRVRGSHGGDAAARPARRRRRSRRPGRRGPLMPRPERQTITFSIDGLEIQAPENIMLADAAKYGDIEIPVFCYEPKLGSPVGACRMCLVEIEGIPKLQTACSSPVKDGMVVHTQTARVKEAQQAVVEFLLINHPLDCPVCDKGGECPLQDITFGWGPGRSRFIEPKRHFQKPLELSPLIAIDRERCILCYRCVRFSQELSEDYQLVLLERGAHTFVGTFDGHPYVAPFSGNIIQLCPVGALTSIPYRFRARPWDIEGSGSICMLCPAQCNTELTVRDDRVLRVLDRHHEGVDDGWLCDKGRFAYQAIHAEDRLTGPLVRDGDGELRPATWEEAYTRATEILAAAGERTAALAGPGQTNEEGMLLAGLLRDGLGSAHLDSAPGGAVPLELLRSLAAPELQAGVADLEFAHAVLVVDCEPVDDAPILDLRIRKGVRRNKVKLAVATSRPSSLDPIAAATARFAPGHVAGLLAGLSGALTGGDLDALAGAAGCTPAELGGLAGALSGAEEIVVLYGERLLVAGADRLLHLAGQLGVGATDGAGLIGIPDGANGRGLREVGVLPNAGPGLAPPPAPGRDAAGIAQGLAERELEAVYLLGVDPVRSHPGRAVWAAGLETAAGVIAHASFLTGAVSATRRCRLPVGGRGREGGHRDPPGRAPPATATGDRATGGGPRRVAGTGRAVAPPGRRPGAADDRRGRATACSRPCRSTPA